MHGRCSLFRADNAPCKKGRCIKLITYQDFTKSPDRIKIINNAIAEHQKSDLYKTALDADLYYLHQNPDILRFSRMYYDQFGIKRKDESASDFRLCNDLFQKIVNQRVNHSLRNGVTFERDDTIGKLGRLFDSELSKAARLALVEGVSYPYWAGDHLHVFSVREFVPLIDEENENTLRAGIRFWRIDSRKPMQIRVYDESGIAHYIQDDEGTYFVKQEAYKTKIIRLGESVEEHPESWGRIPIFRFWGSERRQSLLVGNRQRLFAYDMIDSGFANSVNDAIYAVVIVNGGDGMTDKERANLLDRMRQNRIIDTPDGSSLTMHNSEPPYVAQTQRLETLRRDIYDALGGMDVRSVSNGSRTATEIKALYEVLNAAADDLEDQVYEFITALLKMLGIDDTPHLRRAAGIVNDSENVNNIVTAVTNGLMDRQTAVGKMPIIDPDEVDTVLERLRGEEMERFDGGKA